MIAGFHSEALMAAGYALFLASVAKGQELLARGSHRRAGKFEVAGFRYRPEGDIWECPAEERLARGETDPRRRVVQYRAPSHVCNACSMKPCCTDSDAGRLLELPLDSWLGSEIRRFHRAISIVLLVLSAAILVWEILVFSGASDRLLLAGSFVPVAFLGAKLASESMRKEEAAQKPGSP